MRIGFLWVQGYARVWSYRAQPSGAKMTFQQPASLVLMGLFHQVLHSSEIPRLGSGISLTISGSHNLTPCKQQKMCLLDSLPETSLTIQCHFESDRMSGKGANLNPIWEDSRVLTRRSKVTGSTLPALTKSLYLLAFAFCSKEISIYKRGMGQGAWRQEFLLLPLYLTSR